MTDTATIDAYGAVTAPATLTIQRILPGPVERVWSYLTDSDMRAKWLAAGEMPLTPGAEFNLTWRNDDLSDPPGKRPEGFSKEHTMTCAIIEADPPRTLAFRFGEHGNVTITLEPRGKTVLLTLVHARIPNRSTMLSVSGGWHAHLDVLVAVANGKAPKSFWDSVARLKPEYEKRIPA
jgi:uncharacterized protein YndB with AHSA1/START domain